MKYQIGQRVPREGKTDLIVFECLSDGRYAARTTRQAIRFGDFECTPEELKPGGKARLANGKEIVLVDQRSTGYWDNAWNDRIELTESEIEEALADAHARQIYTTVATRRETGGNSRNIRFLPRRMAPREAD